jgi:hypothetical protein
MRCSACGRENPEGSQYCSGCGSKLGVRVKGMEASGMGVKPKVTSTVGMGQIRHTVPPPGMCFYHPSIPSQFVCTRCGRPICGSCVKKMGGMIFCVNCAGSVPYTRERPTGVTIIAALEFIGAFLTFISGILYIDMGSSYWYSDDFFVFLGLLFIILSVVDVALGIGLLQGKNWARIIYLGFCVLGILSIIPIIFIWYLTRPHVKEFFGVT